MRNVYMKNIVIIILSISTCNQLYCNELDTIESLVNQKRKIEFNMTKLRVKLMTEKSELKKLNNSILKQQKILMKKLDEQPEIQFLTNKLNGINKKLGK